MSIPIHHSRMSRLEGVIPPRAYWKVMKSDSPFFDRIKVKPDKDRRIRTDAPVCEWPGCKGAATHRAPKGRNLENEYWRFCLAHVREYNHSYNFFAGMTNDDVAKYQRDALTGHRPTWKMGMNGGGKSDAAGADDPLGLGREFGAATSRRGSERKADAPMVGNAARKAFEALGLEADATTIEIKSRFKALVKRHHPDANGGDRSTEDRLREIIQAYNYLKSIGFR
jgi:hypothetical protein